MPLYEGNMFVPFETVPECSECDDALAYLDSLMVIHPDKDKANYHYFLCVNEDCGLCYHVMTRFDDESAPLYHGCYSGAYPDVVDARAEEMKGMNHG